MDCFFQPRLDSQKIHLLRTMHVCLAMFRQAGSALLLPDPATALSVLAASSDLDRSRRHIEEQFVCLLALGKPVAKDLRYIVAAMRICALSTQVSSGALRLAEQSMRLSGRPRSEPPASLNQAVDRCTELFSLSIKAFASLDCGLAAKVRELAGLSSAGRSVSVLACSPKAGWNGAVEISALAACAVALDQVAQASSGIADQVRFAVDPAEPNPAGDGSSLLRRSAAAIH